MRGLVPYLVEKLAGLHQMQYMFFMCICNLLGGKTCCDNVLGGILISCNTSLGGDAFACMSEQHDMWFKRSNNESWHCMEQTISNVSHIGMTDSIHDNCKQQSVAWLGGTWNEPKFAMEYTCALNVPMVWTTLISVCGVHEMDFSLRGNFAWCSLVFLLLAVLWRRWSIRWWIESRLSRKTKRKRRQRYFRFCCQRRALFFMVTMCSFESGFSMMSADDLFRRIDSLSQAATTAAQAAVTVLNHFDQSSPRTGGGEQQRFGEASRVLKQPDSFEADDPIKFHNWRMQFMNWLTYGDPRYHDLMRYVETNNIDDVSDMNAFSDSSKELSQQLHTILSSYVKGPATALVRSTWQDRNGFKLWKELMNQYVPATRQRALGLSQAILQYPVITKDRSLQENLMSLESLVEQYQDASGERLPDNLLISTVLRCVNQQVRQHLQLTIDDKATYKNVRERLMNYENNAKTWTAESLLKQVQDAGQASGPTPMEVDYVGEKGYYNKGKGQKGKGKHDKGKGKGSGWSNFNWLTGGGYGKSKGKQKGKSKGKNKGKGKKGGGKKGGGKVQPGNCRICGQYGHWGNECPQRNNQQAQQVQATNADVPRPAQPPVPLAPHGYAPSQASTRFSESGSQSGTSTNATRQTPSDVPCWYTT